MDQKLLFLINREWTSPFLDLLMMVVTTFDLWLLPMLVLAVFIAIKGGFKGRAFLLTAGLIVGINDGLVSNPLKRLVDRPRPFQSHNEVRQIDLAKAKPRFLALVQPLKVKMSRSNLEDVKGRSFPSSHTINTVSLALVCAAFYRRHGWWAFVLAALVAYSRIYTGSHWPSDVLTSIFLGLGSTLLLLALSESAWRRFGARFFPRLTADNPTLLSA